MLKLLSGITIAVALMFGPQLAKSADLVTQCAALDAHQIKFLGYAKTMAKQIWTVKPEGLAKINKHFGTDADSALLLYFSGNAFGYGLWKCGKPIDGHLVDLTYREMKALMEQIKLESTDTTLVGGKSV